MPKPLREIMTWKGRTAPGEMIIPPHLKLAILARGHAWVPPANVQWLLDQAEKKGATWPSRLKSDLEHIFKELRVTVELFLNKRPIMTDEDIEEVLQAYISIRHAKYPSRCFFLLFTWGTHAHRQQFEKLLCVDFTRLYSRAGVTVAKSEPRRFILLVYVCLSEKIKKYIALERRSITAPPPPAEKMPALEAITAEAYYNLRMKPNTGSKILGANAGYRVPVSILNKFKDEEYFWYEIRLKDDLPVRQNGKDLLLRAGTRCWTVKDNLECVAATWSFFRYQLIQFENGYQDLSLNDLITKMRQMSHEKETPFDAVIGTESGSVYQNTQPFVPGEWQFLKDYEQVRAPDGRIIDVKHILCGIDVLWRPERRVKYMIEPVGTNYAAATWSGDLGGGAAEMTLKLDDEWEKRNADATHAVRAARYFRTRAPDWDLLADIDAWGLHALRSRYADLRSVDELLASYYENYEDSWGGTGMLTSGRKEALELFLRHYGFTYKGQHLSGRSTLRKQVAAYRRLWNEINTFAKIWMYYRKPALLIERPQERERPKDTDVTAMTERFAMWLERTSIEYGARAAEAKP